MLHQVKVFKPTEELCYKNGMKLTRIYTSEEVQSRANELFKALKESRLNLLIRLFSPGSHYV